MGTQKILIKKSTVAAKVPTATDLDIGELAVNTADAKLYTKHNDGTVKLIGNGVFEPAFSKNAAFNKNFGSVSDTVCQGNDSRLNDARTPADSSVSYSKIATDLAQRVAVSASDIDWSSGGIYTKTISGAATFTFSNLKLNKTVTLVISGNYTITLPAYCKKISGTYDGTVTNYLQFHCTNATGGSEEVWFTISKQAT